MRSFITTIVVILSFLNCTGQDKMPAGKRPNIIWITCEDISPYIGAYGYQQVKTPNIDRLAREGVKYNYVYTTAGVCAPSRSSIITGMYPTSIGTQHMRTGGNPKYQPVPPYSAVIPPEVKCFPEFLRKAGYYCTNNEKQDYQFTAPVTVWDENGPAASFANRKEGQPFFAVFNFFITHESQLFSRKDSLLLGPATLKIPPLYSDTKIAHHDMARMLTNIQRMDQEVGDFLQMLKDKNLYNDTYIFFYSDHGGSLPWMKRELLERGTHIPFIIRFPGGQNAGIENNDLINGVDFAPTVLSIAGVKVPSYIQGQAFLGSQKQPPREYVYAARDRMDTEYDRVRMARNRRFIYLYNYMPEKPYYQEIEYRLDIPLMKEIIQLRDAGKLNPNTVKWFETKPREELYDAENDPWQLHNLAQNPAYRTELAELRKAFQDWTDRVGDKSGINEMDMIKQMWNGQDHPPVTATPEIVKVKNGVKIKCATPGASVGYRILPRGDSMRFETHTVQSWDAAFANGRPNGGEIKTPRPWRVDDGEMIPLKRGETLQVNAMRIGYQPAIIEYKDGVSTAASVQKK